MSCCMLPIPKVIYLLTTHSMRKVAACRKLFSRRSVKSLRTVYLALILTPNSVKICRLRLWIELLKNAYYTAESNYTYLETLPNIDINIKCGNSLLHRFALTDSIQTVLRESDYQHQPI